MPPFSEDCDMGAVTQHLLALNSGQDQASDQLYSLIYNQLRALAGRQMRSERAGHTLQPTALANEAFLKLIDQTQVEWQDRAHFFAIASRAMRRILIDHARMRARLKRGGGSKRIALDDVVDGAERRGIDLIALDEAMERLAKLDARKAQVVELRFYAGLTMAEVAHVLEVSEKTVKREWALARGWLKSILQDVEQEIVDDV